MIKSKNQSEFDTFVNRILSENLQMPQSVAQNGTLPTNSSKPDQQDDQEENTDEKPESVNKDPKQAEIANNQKTKSNLSNDDNVKVMQIISSLDPEIQNTLKSAKTTQDVQFAIRNIDPDFRTTILNYLSNKDSAEQQNAPQQNTAQQNTVKPAQPPQI